MCNSTKTFRLGLLALALLAASACGSYSALSDEISDPGGQPADTSDLDGFPNNAGATTIGAVDIDGTNIDYVVTLPEGFSQGDEAPVLLAFPAGSQTIEIAEDLVEQTYAPEALRLGWVVVSPAAPDGDLFFQDGAQLLPGFVDWIETWVTPEGGAPHVAGISNGGRSTFAYASQNPGRVSSIVAFPGFASESELDVVGDLDIPIQIFVGGNDSGWIAGAEQTVEANGDINLQIFEGESHIIDSTADGVIVFERLEDAR